MPAQRIEAKKMSIGDPVLRPDELRAYVEASHEITHAFRDKRSVEDVMPALKQIRSRGYRIADSTLTEGLRILAVPVRGQDGDPIGAISIAVPATRSTAENLERDALALVQGAAGEIAKAIEAGGSVGFAL